MRNAVLLGVLLMFPIVLSAEEDPLACVDPLIKETLLGVRGMKSTVSYGLPDDFPPLLLPDEFKLIGSKDDIVYTMIAFVSDLAEESTHDELKTAMEGMGWQYILRHVRYPGMNGGFVSKVKFNPTIPYSFCHDVHGNLQVRGI